MQVLLAVLGPVALIVIGILPMLGTILWQRWRERRHPRRSPLTKDMLRPPGYSLRAKIADINGEINAALVAACIIPLASYAIHVSQSYWAGMPETLGRLVQTLLAACILTLLSAMNLLRLLEQRKHYILGLEGEQATAEELNQLMLAGCRVFHDIPFPYGNIDHVVVSPSGVYSVNTKMRGKPSQGGSAEVTVDHARNVIRFPNGEYQIPAEQLASEAKWLSGVLSESTGEEIAVESILTLPGWYIKERVGRGSFFVINPRKPHKFFIQRRQVLTPQLIDRIAHQLDQRCRDVEVSYRAERSW